jgi:hypothetical protein
MNAEIHADVVLSGAKLRVVIGVRWPRRLSCHFTYHTNSGQPQPQPKNSLTPVPGRAQPDDKHLAAQRSTQDTRASWPRQAASPGGNSPVRGHAALAQLVPQTLDPSHNQRFLSLTSPLHWSESILRRRSRLLASTPPVVRQRTAHRLNASSWRLATTARRLSSPLQKKHLDEVTPKAKIPI